VTSRRESTQISSSKSLHDTSSLCLTQESTTVAVARSALLARVMRIVAIEQDTGRDILGIGIAPIDEVRNAGAIDVWPFPTAESARKATLVGAKARADIWKGRRVSLFLAQECYTR